MERRRHPRVTLRQPVRASSGPVPLFVLDVSRGGLRVAHQSQLPDKDGICRVDLSATNGTAIHLDCAIVHTSIRHANAAAEQLFHSGLRIVTPNPLLDALLKKDEEKE